MRVIRVGVVGRRVVAGGALVAALGVAAVGVGWGGADPATPVATRRQVSGPELSASTTAVRDPGVGGAEDGVFSPTDVAWLQLAVALNERALGVLALAERADDGAVSRLADRIADGHRAEIARFGTLLARAGAPAGNPHSGHDMPGMATAADLAELRRAAGPAFVGLFRDSLRRHVEQSILMARAARNGGAEPATRTLAAEVEAARTRELDQLAALSR